MKLAICNKQNSVECPTDGIRRVVQAALRLERCHAELSIALVDDEGMARLNRQFLGREGVTDVLAFPYESAGPKVEGEIVVNAELAVREAEGRKHGPREELLLYVAHGLLHILGYDDHDPEQTRRMRRREQQVLNAAGFQAHY